MAAPDRFVVLLPGLREREVGLVDAADALYLGPDQSFAFIDAAVHLGGDHLGAAWFRPSGHHPDGDLVATRWHEAACGDRGVDYDLSNSAGAMGTMRADRSALETTIDPGGMAEILGLGWEDRTACWAVRLQGLAAAALDALRAAAMSRRQIGSRRRWVRLEIVNKWLPV